MALDVKNICTEQWRLYDLDALISIAEDDIADAITKKQIQTCKDYTNIVLRTAGKAVVTMREILQLSAHGYPDGALALARNIYENMIVVAFFENKKHNSNRFVKYIEDYYADYDIQRIRALLYESKYCTQNVEETQKLTDELEKTKKRVNHRGNGDYWWAGCKSFSALVDTAIESVDDRRGQHFLHMLHFTYKRALNDPTQSEQAVVSCLDRVGLFFVCSPCGSRVTGFLTWDTIRRRLKANSSKSERKTCE